MFDMEWNAFNIAVSAIFALCENALYLIMRKTGSKKATAVCSVLSVTLYISVLCFLLLNGATLKQTALVILSSLPGAFAFSAKF